MNKLTAKQKRFADYYLACLNASESAVKAGYSKKTAKEIGCENLTKPNIAEYIKKAQDKTANKLEITRETLVRDLTEIKQLALTPTGEYGNLELRNAISAMQEQAKLLGLYAPVETNSKLSIIGSKSNKELRDELDSLRA